MITIGLIDNYPVAQHGISVLLSLYFTDALLIKAKNTSEFSRLNKTLLPDIILLGVNDDSISGSIRTVSECRWRFPAVALIVYDQNYYPDSSSLFFKLGVKGHIQKSSSVNELMACIEAVLEGKQYLSTELDHT